MRKVHAPERILTASRHHPIGRIILDAPEFPGQVLRRHSIRNLAGELALSPKQLIKIGDHHLKQLAACGLNIPSHIDYLDAPEGWHWWRNRRNPPRVDLYTLVERIHGHELLADPNPEQYANITLEALQKYFAWIVDTHQPYHLYEAGALRQYMVGRAGNAMQAALYMVDVEPDLAPTASNRRAEQHTISGHWELAMEDIEEWKSLATA